MITHIAQGKDGCFIACLAMLLGKNYQQAFQLAFPNQNYQNSSAILHPEQAFKILQQTSLSPKEVKIRNLNLLHKTSIIWLRWNFAPKYSHCVVYEAKTKLFHDPSRSNPLNQVQKNNLQRQITNVFYLDGYQDISHPAKDTSIFATHLPDGNCTCFKCVQFFLQQRLNKLKLINGSHNKLY